MNWKWYEILGKEVNYSWQNLVPESAVCIGIVNDEDADYSHTEHRLYKVSRKYVYVHSSGCSCWDSSDAVDEWRNRKQFNSKKELIEFLNKGLYDGYTIPDDVMIEIKKSLKRLVQ